MDSRTQLLEGLDLLGSLLQERGETHELVIIGGAALLLLEVIDRPTLDVDVVALGDGRTLTNARPLPADLVLAVREVGRALDLPTRDAGGKDWLNAAPAILLRLGLPDGFADRLSTTTHGGLTLRLPSRRDLVALKLWAATSAQRARRAVDIADLRALSPSISDLRAGLEWSALLDGRPEFWELDARPILEQLGFDLDEVRHG